MSESEVELVYDGEALKAGAMDVFDLAPALLAFGELCQEANRIINGDRARLTVCVQTDFHDGSFRSLLSLILERGEAITFEGFKDAKTIVELVWGKVSLVSLMKWLKNRKPSSVTQLPDGKVHVEISGSDNDVTINYFDGPKEIVDLANAPAVRRALAIVMKPLERDGIDEVKVVEGITALESVTKSETAYFELPPGTEEAHVETRETVVEVIKPSFRKGLKWMFSEGGGTFSADIEDEDFLKDVDHQKLSFTAGDMLRVRLWKRSFRTPTGLTANFKILRVVKIHHMPKQLPLRET